MPRVIEYIDDVRVELEINGSVPRREGKRGREYGPLLSVIQDEFPNVTRVTIDCNSPIRFTVLPEKGESIESLIDRCEVLQSLCVDQGIVSV